MLLIILNLKTRLSAFIAVLLFILPQTIAAQAVFNVNGIPLEVIGLETWTSAMFMDSVKLKLNTDDLTSAVCAAVLKNKLGFVEAEAMRYVDEKSEKTDFISIIVVESTYKNRIRYSPAPTIKRRTRSEWNSAAQVFADSPEEFQMFIQSPDLYFKDSDNISKTVNISPETITLQKFLVTHRTRKFLELAGYTLANDGNTTNRVVALLLLINFQDDPKAWKALLEAVLDSDQIVASTASQVLSGLSRAKARTIDWSQSRDAIRAIINGTNLPSQDMVLVALSRTGISPQLASFVLKDGGNVLLGKLQSSREEVRRPSHDFLVAISGKDFGRDREQWRNWISNLTP